MAIVVESTSSGNFASGSVTINKPTGLAVGDLMILVLASESNALSTPSGWTVIQAGSTLINSIWSIYYKIATSGDVAASNFTFNAFSGTFEIGGVIYRITGNADVSLIQKVRGNNNNNPATVGVSITPNSSRSVLINSWCASDNNGDTATFSAYSSTGTPTYTEVYDDSNNDESDNTSLGSAWAYYNSQTTITSFSVTVTGGVDDQQGILIVVPEKVDASGTNNLHTASPTFFEPTGTAGVSATTDLHTTSPTFFEPTGRATEKKWFYEEKPTLPVWTDEEKPL